MQSVLIGVDHSESSWRALRLALEGAMAFGWSVTIVHVIYWNRYALKTLEDNERRPIVKKTEIERAQSEVIDAALAWAKKEGLIEGVDIATQIRHGRPSELLVDIAQGEGHDLIFVGRTGESQLKTAIFGSTASRLGEHSPVPVVIVP